MIINLLLIGIAGGLGAVSRFGVGLLVIRFLPEEHFPWATFVVNMLGCLLFGLIFAAIEVSTHWDPDTKARIRMVLLTGFMGAFTTYSTYAFQSAMLLEQAKWMPAILNMVGHTGAGVFLIFAGLWSGKHLF